MKKGVLLTISLVMIASIALTLSILNFINAETTKDRSAEIGSLERLYSISDSIAIGFKEIFNTYSGINITINNRSISFEEFLPNNNVNTFKNNLDNYKSYIEGQDSTIFLNTSTLKNELPLIILPHNITYKHNSLGGNKIIINPAQINFNKYYINIGPGLNITSCIWSTSPGSLTFQLVTNNPSCDNTVNINPNQSNSININNGGILINMSKDLEIENNLGMVKVKAIISLNEIANEKIMVWSDKSVINIKYLNLNISKNSGFRII